MISQKRSLTTVKRPVVSACAMPTAACPNIARRFRSCRCSLACDRLRAVTSALTIKLRTEAQLMKMTKGRTPAFAGVTAKGPTPINAPQTARHERMRAVVAVSRGSHRKAAHSKGSAARQLSVLQLLVHPTSGLKAMSPTRRAAKNAKLAGRMVSGFQDRQSLIAQRIITGAMTRVLAMSRSHHVAHVVAKFAHSTCPAR